MGEIVKQHKVDPFLHALNVPPTRTRQKVPVTPAKDIMTFAMGFDSYGTSHLPLKLPERVVRQIQARRAARAFGYGGQSPTAVPIPEEDAQVFRVFNRTDYGYYRSSIDKLDQVIPHDDKCLLRIEKLFEKDASEYQLRKVRRAFNVERQAIEAKQLQETIKESSSLKHFESKEYAKDGLRLIVNRVT